METQEVLKDYWDTQRELLALRLLKLTGYDHVYNVRMMEMGVEETLGKVTSWLKNQGEPSPLTLDEFLMLAILSLEEGNPVKAKEWILRAQAVLSGGLP